jgi:hypothetical protein
MDKCHIISALYRHIAQRSGIDIRNYYDREAAMGDYRMILRDGRHARAMLRAVELSSMTADNLIFGFRAYSGRLSYDAARGCEYVTGQYFPTEYRAAACAVLANALQRHYGTDETGFSVKRAHAWAKRNLGRAIANRWFL